MSALEVRIVVCLPKSPRVKPCDIVPLPLKQASRISTNSPSNAFPAVVCRACTIRSETFTPCPSPTFSGQEKVGDGQGVKVSDLIVQPRQTTAGKAFEGELVLILDACFSGKGTISQGLTLGDLGKQTTILTSSADIQESFSLD